MTVNNAEHRSQAAPCPYVFFRGGVSAIMLTDEDSEARRAEVTCPSCCQRQKLTSDRVQSVPTLHYITMPDASSPWSTQVERYFQSFNKY